MCLGRFELWLTAQEKIGQEAKPSLAHLGFHSLAHLPSLAHFTTKFHSLAHLPEQGGRGEHGGRGEGVHIGNKGGRGEQAGRGGCI